MSNAKNDATYRARQKQAGVTQVRIQLGPELTQFVERSGKPRAVFVKELVEQAARNARNIGTNEGGQTA